MKSKRNLIVLVLLAVVATAVLTGCTKKRCNCITTRAGFQNARGIEDLGEHANCSELDAEWTSADSTHQLLNKTCTPAD